MSAISIQIFRLPPDVHRRRQMETGRRTVDPLVRRDFYPGIYWLSTPTHRRCLVLATATHEDASKRLGGLRAGIARSTTHLSVFSRPICAGITPTGDPAVHKQIVIDAEAEHWQQRTDRRVCCARLSVNESLFIDIMMNVDAIFWARQYHQRRSTSANRHRNDCRTTQKYLVRSDGGTALEGISRRTTGQFIRPDDAPRLRQHWPHLDARPGMGDLRFHGGASARAALQEFLDTARAAAASVICSARWP